MEMGKYYFIHDYNPALDYSDGKIISLYPDVSYQLDRKGYQYDTPIDFYSEHDIFARQRSHFMEYLEWVSIFDNILKEHISFLRHNNIRLASINTSVFKYFIDELFIESFTIRKILERIGPDNVIVYVRHKSRGKKDYSLHTFNKLEKNNLMLDLLALNNKIDLTISEFVGKKHQIKAVKRYPKNSKIVAKSILKKIYEISKYNKLSSCLHVSSKNNKFLVLHPGSYQMDEIIRALIKMGYEVFGLSDGKITKYNTLDNKKVFDIYDTSDLDPVSAEKEIEKLSCRIYQENSLFRWLDEMSGFSVKDIVSPFFKKFIKNICSDTIFFTKRFMDFIDREKIDVVLATNSDDAHARGAILAATILGKKKVCFQHGIHAYFDRHIVMTDMVPFDMYFTTDYFSEKMYKSTEAKKYSKACKVDLSGHYLSRIKPWKRKGYSIERHKKTFLYVPTKVVSYRRSITVPTYPIDWYYEYQKILIDIFGKMKRCTFIYKQPRTSCDMPYKSIIPYFSNEKRYKNIVLRTGKLIDYFSLVDGVILDRPTTSTFEASSSGVPFICLCSDFVSHGLDDNFKSFLGGSLRIISKTEEVEKHIKSFIENPKKNYINRNLYPDPKVESTIEKICKLACFSG